MTLHHPRDEIPMRKQTRKLKVLVISMGGTRQEQIKNMFSSSDDLMDHFEPPVFSPGVPQRELRNRYKFLYWANQAGLLPAEEWEAIHHANATGNYDGPMSNRFFDCLNDIPVSSPGQQRRGSANDVKLHYSVELWIKGRALNRGRAVLACTWAHLIALRKLTEDASSSSSSFDMILEDNVRTMLDGTLLSKRIWDTLEAKSQWERENNDECHLLYFGWLGSVTNLEWVLQTHAPRRGYVRRFDSSGNKKNTTSIFPFPRQEHLDEDLVEMEREEEEEEVEAKKDEVERKAVDVDKYQHTKPGGNPIWGMYAYWVSKEGFEKLMECLRNDVGAMLWKGKRARAYSVKPIDKIVPRQIMTSMGLSSVQLSTHPSFFRAPMLTSKIHTQWDPEFCKSTGYQLQSTGLEWSDLKLERGEEEVVQHHSQTGDWLTMAELSTRNGETLNEDNEKGMNTL